MLNEYPELTAEAQALLDSCSHHSLSADALRSKRREIAAILREALQLAMHPLPVPPGSRSVLVGAGTVERLKNLAKNLHPPLPSLEEAREAARQLGGPQAEIVHAFLKSLNANV